MDNELVALAQQGDQGAFESLTLAHHTRLFRVAHGILRDRHLAEDATQQAFLDMLRGEARSNFDRDYAFRPCSSVMMI